MYSLEVAEDCLTLDEWMGLCAQTDGWLSEQSAKVYEVSTETLFLGRQDAMQRQTLVPLAKALQGRPASGRGVRALEIAAGTGRFATFIKVWGSSVPVPCCGVGRYISLSIRCHVNLGLVAEPGEPPVSC